MNLADRIRALFDGLEPGDALGDLRSTDPEYRECHCTGSAEKIWPVVLN